MDWVSLTSVLGGGIVTLIVSIAVFHHRYYYEVKKKINTTLFCLLEVTFNLHLINYVQSDLFIRRVIERFNLRFPEDKLTKEDERIMREGTLQVLSIGAYYMNGLFNKYNTSIENLSEVFPYQAYKLRKNNHVAVILKNSEENAESGDVKDFLYLRELFQEYYSASITMLESDVKSLAFKSGVKNWWNVRKEVKDVNKKMKGSLSDEDIDAYIDALVASLEE